MSSGIDARAIMDRWCQAFGAADVDGVLGLYAPNAAFLGTSSPRVVCTPDQVQAYFLRAMRERTPKCAQVLELHQQDLGEVAVITALDRIEWSDTAGPTVSMGRVTAVLQCIAGSWLIVHFHRSEVPAG